ncbi:MAG: sporulation integral membrane protein YtvI [Clostridia bacterium]|nr:sporulation integral membrane protein YtvI [Clostridia bacterium]
MNEEKLKRALLYGATLLFAVLTVWLIGKYVFLCFAPFIIAYTVSLAVRPAAAAISGKVGVGKRFVSVFIVIILISIVFLFLSWLVSLLSREMSDLAERISSSLSEDDNVLKRALDTLSSLREKLPFLTDGAAGENVRDSLYNAISGILNDALSEAASAAASAATSFIGKLPGFVFAVVTTVISTFYICTDRGAIPSEIASFVGPVAAGKISRIKSKINRAVSSYMKSYFVLALITFAELFLGLTLLRVKNSFLLALLIAVIDFLPVLGSGIVLIPWALIELTVGGNTRLGVGLLVLVAAMYLIRQFLEPKIVGNMIGIHPLLSLTAVYVGFVVFGFAGVILFPVLLSFIKVALSGRNEVPGK